MERWLSTLSQGFYPTLDMYQVSALVSALNLFPLELALTLHGTNSSGAQ